MQGDAEWRDFNSNLDTSSVKCGSCGSFKFDTSNNDLDGKENTPKKEDGVEDWFEMTKKEFVKLEA